MSQVQLLIVVETNKETLSDDMYIKEVIDTLYDLSSNEITYKFIHMDGKTKFKDKKVTNYINKLMNINSSVTSHVIYCFDTDDIINDPDELIFYNNVKLYCQTNRYDFIWFCKDIEDVFISKTIPDKEKQIEAIRFVKKHKLPPLSKLQAVRENRNQSNILTVFDKYLKRK